MVGNVEQAATPGNLGLIHFLPWNNNLEASLLTGNRISYHGESARVKQSFRIWLVRLQRPVSNPKKQLAMGDESVCLREEFACEYD